MSDITTAFWGMVINNYDETDLALVQQGYPDHVRKIVYTLERGESGTPHIQAYVRLFRQQRLSYVKKLFPRGNFKALTSDEYRLNAERYAQKQDKTAESPSVIINNPFPDPVTELLDVIRDALESFAPTNSIVDWRKLTWKEVEPWTTMVENERVSRKPHLAKFYVSPTYIKVWRTFAPSLLLNVITQVEAERRPEMFVDTHTHTHTDEKFSHAEGITDADSGEDDEEFEEFGEEEPEDGEGDEDGEDSEDEGLSESGSSCSGSSDVGSEY